MSESTEKNLSDGFPPIFWRWPDMNFVVNITYPRPGLMLHPSSGQTNRVMTSIAIVYTVLFFVGICGNTSVLAIMWKFRKRLFSSMDTGILYILSLCFVDFIVILSMPMSIMQITVGNWMLGQPLCRVYWTFESAGKVLSAFILTALSFDRFVGVCHPLKVGLRSKKFALGLIFTLTVSAFLLLLPLPLHARVETQISTLIHVIYSSRTRFVKLQCSTHSMPRALFKAFTFYIFSCAFCVPAVCITAFYSSMLRRLFTHTRRMNQTVIPIRKVVLYTMAVSTFYFICWLPYWAGTLYFLVNENSVNRAKRIFVYIMYFIHALPYLNSALNWILYAILHSEFARQTDATQDAACNRFTQYTPGPNAGGRRQFPHSDSQRSRPLTALGISDGFLERNPGEDIELEEML